jgi:hypothetical protein
MPVFHLGDLVKPRQDDDNPDALGIILEMSSWYRPEAKILWNDMQVPNWAQLSDVVLAEETP